MSFGKNVQFLRRMCHKMTQEELAEKLGVSRQTVSKWELDTAYPEMDKVIELCRLFSCSMDELIREDMCVADEAYSDIRVTCIDPFYYSPYVVVSTEPENDAITHVTSLAKNLGIEDPEIIGWDFPFLSQEQINVHHMHGYVAAVIVPEQIAEQPNDVVILKQERQKYITITIRNWMEAPFSSVPNAYKLLMTHMNVNGINHKEDKNMISCYEKTYEIDGISYMDVYIAVE